MIVLDREELCRWLTTHPHRVNPLIMSATFVVLPSNTTICELRGTCGLSAVGRHIPEYPETFNQQRGMHSSFNQARMLLWRHYNPDRRGDD